MSALEGAEKMMLDAFANVRKASQETGRDSRDQIMRVAELQVGSIAATSLAAQADHAHVRNLLTLASTGADLGVNIDLRREAYMAAAELLGLTSSATPDPADSDEGLTGD